MRNPFVSQEFDMPGMEAEAAEHFAPLASETLSEAAGTSISQAMLAALASTGRAVGHHGRFAFAGSAVMVPLLAVGAVSAATGESPIAGPVAAIEVAANTLGLASESAPTTNPEPALVVAEDVPAPTAAEEPPPSTGDEPLAGGDVPTDDDGDDSDDGDGGEEESGPAAAAVAAHENGNGCDDVLFETGEPPFATPGGPVGCEVGNSGDHRQNGANHEEDDGEETPDDGDTDETPDEGDTGDDDSAAEEDDAQGGVSHGLGRGHDEDKPGNGNGYGHDKHGHEPNTNGHGPGGPNADDGEDDGDTPEDPEPVASEPAVDNTRSEDSPGNSGNAPGKNKPGKND